jgi:hypothetical protein
MFACETRYVEHIDNLNPLFLSRGLKSIGNGIESPEFRRNSGRIPQMSILFLIMPILSMI